MSLAEIEKAVDRLSPEELAKLADYIARHDKAAWDEELARDFSAGGRLWPLLDDVEKDIRAGRLSDLP
jgi:hypothetical protein